MTDEKHTPNIYKGIKLNPDKSVKSEETLNAEWIQTIASLNNGELDTKSLHMELKCNFINAGNSIRTEDARLKNRECQGDRLRSSANWRADDPLTGCCNKGVNHVEATAYQLNIWGKCCSECFLVQAAQSWNRQVKN